MKKAIYILAGILLIAGAGFWFFNQQGSRYTEPSFIFQAVPLDASVVVESKNIPALLHSMLHENSIFAELFSMKELSRYKETLLFADSLFSEDPNILPCLSGNSFLISLHVTGNNKVSALYYLSLPDVPKNKLNRYFQEIFPDLEPEIKDYEHADIITYRFSEKDAPLIYSFYRSVLIIGTDNILVENSIRQLDVEIDISDSEIFRKISKTSGQNMDANVYINHAVFSKLLQIPIHADFSKILQHLFHDQGWTELDLKAGKDVLQFNGVAAFSDSLGSFLNIFCNQSPARSKLDDFLPANTGFYFSMLIQQPKKFREDLLSYLSRNNRQQAYLNKIKEIDATYEIDIEEIFYASLNREICQVNTDFLNTKPEDNCFTIIEVKSNSVGESNFLKMLENKAGKENKQVKDYTKTYRLDADMSFNIYEMPEPYLMKSLLGDVFGQISNQYFTFVNNYMIMGNSVESLSNFIHYVFLRKTLNTNSNYREMAGMLASESNINVYLNHFHYKNQLPALLQENARSFYKQHLPSLEKIQGFALQASSSGPILFTHVLLTYSPEFKYNTRTLWESLIDTTINLKPFFFTNHNNSEKEVFFQDMKNNIYLINKAGRILWKLPLNEKIKSNVFEVDYFKNRKYQLMFNTENFLHLIDRNGNYVENYPVKLRAPATNPMSIVDYDNNRDYRIFIACADRKVYNYEKNGSLLNGWGFDKTETAVTREVQHFKLADKDFIVFFDQYKVYILNRKGETRVDVKDIVRVSASNTIHFEDTDPDSAYWCTTDTSGMLFFIDLNGNITRQETRGFSKGHFFDYKDINSDNKKDYIFVDKNKLEVYGHSLKPVFTHRFSQTINFPPIYFSFSPTDKRLGVVCDEKNEIFLLDGKGEVSKGFPLKGNTPFSISFFEGNMAKFNLIVGSKNNFLYNYTLQ